jgi:ATP-binding protein involved in chromosome partitioning
MINMFRTTKTKILGIVENMKYMVCPHCSSRVVMHPNDDDRSISKKLGHNLIAEFPFDPRVGQKNAKGQPFYFAETDTDTRKEYDKLAETVIQAASR